MRFTPTKVHQTEAEKLFREPRLSALLESIPSIKSAIKRRDAWRAHIADLPELPPAPFDVEATVSDELISAIRKGATPPADALDRVSAAWRAHASNVNVVTFLSDVDGRFNSAIYDAVRSNGDAVRTALHRQLEECLTKGVHAHKALCGDIDSESALRRGLGDQWRAFDAARAEYAALRHQQRRATEFYDADLDKTATVCELFDAPTDLWAECAAWLRWGFVPNPSTGKPDHVTPPWADKSDAEVFEWIMTQPEARPWIPTTSQRAKAHEYVTGAVDDLGPATPTKRKPRPPQVSAYAIEMWVLAQRDAGNLAAHQAADTLAVSLP